MNLWYSDLAMERPFSLTVTGVTKMVSQIRGEEFTELQELMQAHSIMQSLMSITNIPQEEYEHNWQRVKGLLADAKLHALRIHGLVEKYDIAITRALMISKRNETLRLFEFIHGILSKIGREEIDFENKLEFISKKADEAREKGGIARNTSPMVKRRAWMKVYEDYHRIYGTIQQELASLIKNIKQLLMLEGHIDRLLDS